VDTGQSRDDDIDVIPNTLAGQAHEAMTTAPELYADSTIRFLLAGSSEAAA